MNFNRTLLPFFVAIFSLIFNATAVAQYMWLDASGRKVFSDQPPPPNIPEKSILQQPSKATATTAANRAEKPSADAQTDDAKAAAKAKSDTAKATTSKDKDLEAAKKKLDDEAAAKKKEEQEARDAAKADNCARAKQAKTTFDSGIRLSTVNAKGEREVMDDATRMVESKRVEGIIAKDCKVN